MGLIPKIQLQIMGNEYNKIKQTMGVSNPTLSDWANYKKQQLVQPTVQTQPQQTNSNDGEYTLTAYDIVKDGVSLLAGRVKTNQSLTKRTQTVGGGGLIGGSSQNTTKLG